MKATIESTWRWQTMTDVQGRSAAVQIFEGETESGIAFVAYVMAVQIMPDDDRKVEFAREVLANRVPSDRALRALGAAARRTEKEAR